MANALFEVLVTDQQLEGNGAESDVDSGAVVDFYGIVRRLENGRQIEGIEYEAHTAMAEHQMRQIAETAVARFALRKVRLHHRIGFVPRGEPSLRLTVRAAHRGAAFDASKWIVDELKERVPIWKKPVFAKATAGNGGASAAIER